MSTFAKRVVLITGAGSGIGRQFARTLAAEGAAIAAVDLKEDPLAALAAELSGQTVAWAVGDVTDRSSLHTAVNQLKEKLGAIDLLIASAGIGRETSALTFQAAEFEALIQVNLVGVANSIAAVLPDMLARRQGHLVALSSLASFRGLPRMLGYCASKAGVNSLLDGLRLELKPHGIAVTTLCPGWIRTPMTANVAAAQPHLMEVEEAVRRMVEAIRRRRPFYAFPRSAAWRLALIRWLPCRLSDWMVARALK